MYQSLLLVNNVDDMFKLTTKVIWWWQ